MGCNYYLHLKRNYDPDNILDEPDNTVLKLVNGYVWNNTYYKDLRELNKEYYLELHIGKASCGWHFSLCIYPELGINTLEDWKNLFKNNIIYNEYDKEVPEAEMLDTITNRARKDYNPDNQEEWEKENVDNFNKLEESLFNNNRVYKTYDEVLDYNNAERGLNGLWAHKGHIRTNGTYDLTTYWDFC